MTSGHPRYRIIGPPQPASGEEMPTEPDALEAHRDSLYRRLEMGYARIEQGLAEGSDVTTWEDFWVQLLREYEKVTEELQRDLSS